MERLILFGAMASMVIVALAVPDAFGDTAVMFGVTYFVIRLLHVLMYKRVAPPETRAAVQRVAPGILGGPALLVVAGFVDGLLASILWIVALAIDIELPFVRGIEGFYCDIGHFIERHQLIMIIALGESIVAIGVGIEQLTSGLIVVLAVLLGFTLTVALW